MMIVMHHGYASTWYCHVLYVIVVHLRSSIFCSCICMRHVALMLNMFMMMEKEIKWLNNNKPPPSSMGSSHSAAKPNFFSAATFAFMGRP